MSSFCTDSQETLDLLKQARAGNRVAFDTLFAQQVEPLKRFVRLRIDSRVRVRVDVSDIVQETQLAAFQRFNDYFDRRPMPFAIWLRKNAFDLLRNARRNHVEAQKRSVGREEPLPDRSSVLIAAKLHGRFATPSERVSQEEYRQRVSAVVDQLDESDRELLLMRNVEGRSHQEIACLLEIDPAAARKRYARSLMRLEALLVRNGLTEWTS